MTPTREQAARETARDRLVQAALRFVHGKRKENLPRATENELARALDEAVSGYEVT